MDNVQLKNFLVEHGVDENAASLIEGKQFIKYCRNVCFIYDIVLRNIEIKVILSNIL